MVLMILYEISRHLGLRISDLGSRSFFRIFVIFFYFSSFWDISLIRGWRWTLKKRCILESTKLLVGRLVSFPIPGIWIQKSSYSLIIMSSFLIGALGSKGLLRPSWISLKGGVVIRQFVSFKAH